MENSVAKKSYLVLMLLLIIIAFCLGWYTFSYWHGLEEQKQIRQIPDSENLVLESVPIESSDIPFVRKYIGYVTAIHEAEIQPFINGFIERIFVKGGEFVHRGDLLLVLEQSQYRAALNAAQADVLKAEATYKNAQVYYERLQKAGSKAVSATDKDNAEAQLLAARATVEQAKANLTLAEVNLGYTVIRAPIDGIIGNITLTPGNYVSPAGGTLLSIMQYNPVRVVFSVTDKEYLQELNKPYPFAGDKISLQLSDGGMFPYNGIFKYTDNIVNRQTNAVAVYADFKNIGKTLMPNAYVTVLIEKMLKNAVKIAKDNVFPEDKGNYIFLIRNGKLIKEKVDILAADNNSFILNNSFRPGDFIVTQNVNTQDLGKAAQPQILNTVQKE